MQNDIVLGEQINKTFFLCFTIKQNDDKSGPHRFKVNALY